MMKTLRQSLIDYDMALLEAIADCRAVSLTTPSKGDAVNALTQSLLSPTQTSIILNGLSSAEKETLQFLLNRGGQIEGPRFTRQYGVIRSMGAARLEREKPWHKPANPAEGLWYKGFIFRAFKLTSQGNLELIYIPSDLLSILRLVMEPNQETGAGKQINTGKEIEPVKQTNVDERNINILPTLIPYPNYVVSGEGRLQESMFSLLAYLHSHPTRLKNSDQLSDIDKKTVADCLPPPLLPSFDTRAELDFLLHLGSRAGLLTPKYGRLRPEREIARDWLQASDLERAQRLQNCWRADPTWNDLWHIPGLVLRPTGWENSPLLARSKILEHLAETATKVSIGDWLSLDDFIIKIKRYDPDFQRPDGDYESWYIYDVENNPLMGFAHWDAIEGSLIRYLVTNILLLLGVTDVGLTSRTTMPISFKLTPQGRAFLTNQAISQPVRKSPFIRVGADFQVDVPTQANLYDRFQLTRFSRLDRREENRTVYKITQTSVGQALRNGIAADQIVAFLARASNNQTPLKVVETLRLWGRRQGTAQLERVIILRLEHESLVEELRQHPAVQPLLGEVLGPTTILIPVDNVRKVRRLLVELGYLIDDEEKP